MWHVPRTRCSSSLGTEPSYAASNPHTPPCVRHPVLLGTKLTPIPCPGSPEAPANQHPPAPCIPSPLRVAAQPLLSVGWLGVQLN